MVFNSVKFSCVSQSITVQLYFFSFNIHVLFINENERILTTFLFYKHILSLNKKLFSSIYVVNIVIKINNSQNFSTFFFLQIVFIIAKNVCFFLRNLNFVWTIENMTVFIFIHLPKCMQCEHYANDTFAHSWDSLDSVQRRIL